MVKEFGIDLGQPYLKHIEDKIWEMRPGSSRILYFIYTRKKFVLLHGFTKKTRKTPQKEIRLAEKREKDYEQKKNNVDLHFEELMQNPEFKKAYDDLGPVYKLIREIVAYRIKHGISQKELANRIGTKQSSISRFETAMKMPSLSFLNQITDALGLKWEINFNSKTA